MWASQTTHAHVSQPSAVGIPPAVVTSHTMVVSTSLTLASLHSTCGKLSPLLSLLSECTMPFPPAPPLLPHLSWCSDDHCTDPHVMRVMTTILILIHL